MVPWYTTTIIKARRSGRLLLSFVLMSLFGSNAAAVRPRDKAVADLSAAVEAAKSGGHKAIDALVDALQVAKAAGVDDAAFSAAAAQVQRLLDARLAEHRRAKCVP